MEGFPELTAFQPNPVGETMSDKRAGALWCRAKIGGFLGGGLVSLSESLVCHPEIRDQDWSL